MALVHYTVVHPQFRKTEKMLYDIALLKLTTEVSPGPESFPLLAQQDIGSAELPLTLAGWGLRKEDSPNSNTQKLNKIELQPMVFETCENSYNLRGVDLFESEQLCAQNPLNEDDGLVAGICQGDIGSPLFDKEWVIYGIASLTLGCGQPGYPPVFTKVSAFRKWIADVRNAGE